MASSWREGRQASQRLILDSGAVIALARGDQRARAFLARVLELGEPVEVPVVVVAETIRGGPRDAPVHRVLKAVGSVPEAREVHGRTRRLWRKEPRATDQGCFVSAGSRPAEPARDSRSFSSPSSSDLFACANSACASWARPKR